MISDSQRQRLNIILCTVCLQFFWFIRLCLVNEYPCNITLYSLFFTIFLPFFLPHISSLNSLVISFLNWLLQFRPLPYHSNVPSSDDREYTDNENENYIERKVSRDGLNQESDPSSVTFSLGLSQSQGFKQGSSQKGFSQGFSERLGGGPGGDGGGPFRTPLKVSIDGDRRQWRTPSPRAVSLKLQVELQRALAKVRVITSYYCINQYLLVFISIQLAPREQ